MSKGGTGSPCAAHGKKRVCVIGAGLSGLTTAAEALKNGFAVTLLELRAGVGGLFNREDAQHCTDQWSAWDGLHLTISNYLMAFSDDPPGEGESRRFWSRREYRDYLQEYARKRGVLPRIRFGVRCTSVRRLVAGGQQRYRVAFVDVGRAARGGTPAAVGEEEDEEEEEWFDAVAVCTGVNQKPVTPVVPGLATFPGVTRHSGDFNGARGDPAFEGRRVAVVGFGESGSDSFRAVSEVSASTLLSLRSTPFVVQRLLHDPAKYTVGAAADAVTSPGHHLLERNVAVWLVMLVLSCVHCLLAALGGAARAATRAAKREGAAAAVDAFGQAMGKGVRHVDRDTPYSARAARLQRQWNSVSRFQTFATKNFASAQALVRASTRINTSGLARVQGHTLHFRDGGRADVDTILWNTGYVADFAFLAPELRPSCGTRSLFKHAFKPGQDGTLAFIGWARPSFGGVPMCAEMTARYWMQLLRGQRVLPAEAEARRLAQRDSDTYSELFPLSNLDTLVDLVLFMDGMAELIGCRPPIWRFLLTGQLDLVWRYYYGQHVPSWYRLCGPGSDFARHATVIRRLPVCLTAWNTVKHACANVVNSTGLVSRAKRYALMEWFDL